MTLLPIIISGAKRSLAMTLVELLVAVTASSFVLAAAIIMWIFSVKSFTSAGNYMDLDSKSRYAVDLMLRDIRNATGVVGYQKNGSNNWLQVTNTMTPNSGAKFLWDSTSRNLVCQKPGQADYTFLTQCDAWNFDLYQRTPLPGGAYTFYPATNAWGTTDVSVVKLINMEWKCSRTILGKKINTENVQTAEVMLRNKR